MRRLFAFCVLFSACLFAQEAPLQAPARDPGPQASTPRNYQGCVIRSGGKIMLSEPSGTEYILVSTSRKLDSYVGQEVKILASDLNPNDPSSDERSILTGEPQLEPTTLDVQYIEKVADHCKSPK